MFLYWIESENRYVHRQSDVPKGAPLDRHDIPTDTQGLMAFLNDLRAAQPANAAVEESPGLLEETEAPPPPPPAAPSVYDDVAVEEHIHNADPMRLKTLVSCICHRMKELAQ